MENLTREAVEYIQAFNFGLITFDEALEMIEYLESLPYFARTKEWDQQVDIPLSILDYAIHTDSFFIEA